MLGDREEAEDVVQHTFFAAYRDLTTTERAYHLRAWLFTIVRNRCLSILRARRERVSLEDVEPSTDGLAAEVERRHELRVLLGDLHGFPRSSARRSCSQSSGHSSTWPSPRCSMSPRTR